MWCVAAWQSDCHKCILFPLASSNNENVMWLHGQIKHVLLLGQHMCMVQLPLHCFYFLNDTSHPHPKL